MKNTSIPDTSLLAQHPGLDPATQYNAENFLADIRHGRYHRFMHRMRSLTATFNNHTLRADTPADLERHYQHIFQIFSFFLGLRCRAETATLSGRADCIITLPGKILILEFKVDQDAAHALSQIEQCDYAAPYEISNLENVAIGINISSKSRAITDWIIKVNGQILPDTISRIPSPLNPNPPIPPKTPKHSMSPLRPPPKKC